MRNMKNILIIFLAILTLFVFVYFGIKNYTQAKTIDKLMITNNELMTTNGKLSEQIKFSVSTQKEKIIWKYKQADQKVITQIKYVPIEGGAEITVDNDDNIVVDVKTKGFCVKPNIDIFYDNGVKGGLSFRLMYWNRWGFCAGVSQELKPYVMIDRRTTDFLPMFDNTSIGLAVGKDILSLAFSVYL